MSPFVIPFIVGGLAALVVLAWVAFVPKRIGSSALAAALGLAFAGYTAWTIAATGVLPIWENHTQNAWGVQVWWDLIIAVGIALFFIVPRARAQGMAIVPWVLFVGATASIGILFMVARLFWLERQDEAAA